MRPHPGRNITSLIFVLCSSLPLGVIARESPSRSEAIKQLDANAARVRAVMNTDSKEVTRTLIWYMANPAGDQPKVLELCADLISKSALPDSVLAAVHGVGGVIDAHVRRKSLTKERKDEIARPLRAAATSTDQRVRFAAVRQLERLGESYLREAVGLYQSFLDKPLDASDEIKRRKNRIDAIRELLRIDGTEAADSIRKATREDDLLSAFAAQTPQSLSPVVKKETEKFVERWKTVVGGGGTK